MASKIAKLAATAVLASIALFGRASADEITINKTNWINHHYYSDKNAPSKSPFTDDEMFTLMMKSYGETNPIRRIESYDFKAVINDPNRRISGEDRIEQTYYDVMDFKDNMTDGINKRLKGIGMKAKVDFRKITLNLWEQKATQKNIDLSKPLSLYGAFDKRFYIEDKYGKRYAAYITFTGYFENFQQLFGFGK